MSPVSHGNSVTASPSDAIRYRHPLFLPLLDPTCWDRTPRQLGSREVKLRGLSRRELSRPVAERAARAYDLPQVIRVMVGYQKKLQEGGVFLVLGKRRGEVAACILGERDRLR